MAEVIAVYEITGKTALLMNNPESMLLPKDPGVKKVKYDAKIDAEKSAYRSNGKGSQLRFPSVAFRNALLTGCKGKKLGKFGAATNAMAGVFAVEDWCLLVAPKTNKPITTYDVLTVRAVVQRSAIPRSRACIPKWSCKLALEIDDDFITPEQAEGFLNLGGKMAGVGDWRPERKGKHGRFTARLVS
jgi:hypothetical protein